MQKKSVKTLVFGCFLLISGSAMAQAAHTEDIRSKSKVYQCGELQWAIESDTSINAAITWGVRVVSLGVNSGSMTACYEPDSKPKYWVRLKTLKNGNKYGARNSCGVQLEIVSSDPRNQGKPSYFEQRYGEEKVQFASCTEVKMCPAKTSGGSGPGMEISEPSVMCHSESDPRIVAKLPSLDQKNQVLKLINSEPQLRFSYERGLSNYRKIMARDKESAKLVAIYKTNFENALFSCDGLGCVRSFVETWETHLSTGSYRRTDYVPRENGGFPYISPKDNSLSDLYYK